MLNLLAQAVDPQLKEIGEKIAEGVSEGLKEGLKTTSENAPTNWILMLTVVALACLGSWALAKFLQTLKEVNKAQDERDSAHRQHVRDLSSEFNLRVREQAADQNANAKEIVAMGKESSVLMAAAAADVKETSKQNKDTVHEVRGILQEHRGALDMALMQLGKPTVAQMFNLPAKEDPKASP